MPPRALRRGLSPLFVVIDAVLLVACAAVVGVGLVLAPFSRRRRILRLAAFGFVYLAVEIVVLAVCLAAWVTRRAHRRAWWRDYHQRLLRWALDTVLGAARRCCGFVVVLDQRSPPRLLDDPQPVLVLARHGGIGDSLALVWLLLDRYDRQVQVVLKEALQWEPMLDVMLNRIGACFLPPTAPEGTPLAGRLGVLARSLGAGDALLLFPEGGNWTPGRWDRAIQRLRSKSRYRAATTAALMPHVLPPRPGGVLACLAARPGLAVAIVAHTGLDTLTSARQTWDALPFSEPMTVRWWPPSAVPDGDEARVEWLTTEWAVIDQWIDARRGQDAGTRPR